MNARYKWIFLSLIIVALLLLGSILAYKYYYQAGVVDALSVSSDGHYAISADEKEQLILWNLHDHKKKILKRKVHIWLAYFIPQTHEYAWQDQNRVLHVNDLSGKTILTHQLPFYVFGFVMTPDHQYFMAGDITDGLHWCDVQHCKTIMKPQSKNPREMIAQMPDILQLAPDNVHVIDSKMSGLGATPADASGVYLWNIRKEKVLHDYLGNQTQTFATLSPDGKYVVAGDVASNQFVWNRATGKKLINNFIRAAIIKQRKSGGVVVDNNIIPAPSDLYSDAILSIKFIDNDHYLVFDKSAHYAVLYQTLNPKPIKYLNLGKTPFPATYDFERDQSMDTSPSAHVLVMAKDLQPGIMVYHYNPKTQTLKKLWDAN